MTSRAPIHPGLYSGDERERRAMARASGAPAAPIASPALDSRGVNPNQSPILQLRPGAEVIPAYFSVISTPASVSGFVAGTSAWYLLNRIRVPDDKPEFILNSIWFELSACDWAGAGGLGAASPTAWGDNTGNTAKIIVGKNLPGTIDTSGNPVWTPAPCHAPGVESSEAPSMLGTKGAAQYLHVAGFAAGKWNDTLGAPKIAYQRNFGLGEVRVQSNSTLDVALVIPRAQLIASKQIVGNAYVGLTIETTADLVRLRGTN